MKARCHDHVVVAVLEKAQGRNEMRRTLKLSLMAGACAAAALTLAAWPANAATAAAIVFQGTTSSLTPVQAVGGTGAYAFSTSTNAGGVVPGWCVDAGATTSPAPAVYVGAGVGGSGCSSSANGSYNNIVCGTGTTGSTAMLGLAETDVAVDTASTVGSASLTVDYGIVFVAGVGVIHGHDADGDLAVGVVDIAPTGGSCATGVTAFTATGVAVLG